MPLPGAEHVIGPLRPPADGLCATDRDGRDDEGAVTLSPEEIRTGSGTMAA